MREIEVISGARVVTKGVEMETMLVHASGEAIGESYMAIDEIGFFLWMWLSNGTD